ncbi:MAG: MFS transporter [Chitinophagales bacterium]|nr:MFS transporter [Bacteroidota bacterium]MCB9042228.1 MFS transporter [Chitinophagales bacterium]
MKYISRVVWILSLVSLFTDTASEMLYPIMPLYLQQIGFSVLYIGILEGIAEAVAGLSKGYFGKWSDNVGRRVPFVRLGYSLSALAKPLLAVFSYPLWIFSARTLDRLGKGIRTAARDALLAEEATPSTKARVFGFHRSMDTLGAVLGPLFALAYLYFYPEDYRTLFLLAFLPGLLAIAATFFLSEKTNAAHKTNLQPPKFGDFLDYWQKSPLAYRKLLIGLLFFTLLNSSDMFLMLKLKEMSWSDSQLIGVYIFYNLVYALFAFPLGMLADKWGIKKIFLLGLCVYALVYVGMGANGSHFIVWGLFCLYGLYVAATESLAKAWVSEVVTEKQTMATAMGTLSAMQSIAGMLGSVLMGAMWYAWGSSWAFVLTGVLVLLVVGYFWVAVPMVGERN